MPPVKHPAPSPPLLLALLLLLTASVATSQDDATRPTWLDCGSASPSPSPAPAPTSGGGGTSFRANLLAILGALPHAAAPTGFASLSLGAGRDRAFVRGLCRGDSAPPQCLADLQVAVRNLSGSCSSSRRAAVWFDKAYATYADTNASTAAEKDFRAILYDVRTVADPGGYEQAYDALMSRLVARAAGGSARMFATGETQYASDDPNGTMYGLVQCMRDLRAADCDRCLQESVPQLPRCCSGHQGGVVLGYNCYLRIQIYTYYDLALDTPPPPAAGPLPPVPSPTAGRERRGKRRSRHAVIAVAVVLPLGTLLLLAFVLTGVYLQRRRSIEENTRPARMPCLRQRRSIKDDSTYVNVHLEKLTLPVLRAATGNFAAENMLGEGGFGEVFKTAGWTGDSSKKALQGLLAGVPRAEKRADARRQAEAQEPCAASWGLLGGKREADRIRVHAESEPRHNPFRCREAAAASAGLEEKTRDHLRDCARPAVPPRGVTAEDHPPGPQAEQRPAGRGYEPQDLGFRAGKSVLGRSIQSRYETTSWNPWVHVAGVRVLRARLDQIGHVQLRSDSP
ncbi:cysteine-rich receptor-like protein kinase 34 isoform X2 [Phragmites australis]|uniref:cysteine-rich receptor-like protein kinase 34 isoform X2 n=1 Tax=Phragmites australis TaxID=29695 RepID=UPI002D76D022|nr:cysteine-rich receptor-like protein kinase 34 isoform X2 [Phragmites australis]